MKTQVEGKLDLTDGIKIWVDENTWILLRPSGTEPVIRIFAESDNKNKLEDTIINMINTGMGFTLLIPNDKYFLNTYIFASSGFYENTKERIDVENGFGFFLGGGIEK